MLNFQFLNTFFLDAVAVQELVSVRQPGTIIGPISRFLGRFYNMLFDLINNSVSAGALGLAIIVFTLIVKTVLIPLMVNQQKSSTKMQMFQPEMNRIRDKYKDKKDQMSQQRMALEMQDFQKKNGISMLGGCLPLLAQLPIFYAMFYIFQNAYMHIDVVGQNYVDIANVILQIPETLRMEAFAPFAQEFVNSYENVDIIKNEGFDLARVNDIVMLINYLKIDDWHQILITLGSAGDALQPLLEMKNNTETFLTISLISAPVLSGPGILVPIAAGGSTFLQSKITMATTPMPSEPGNPAAAMTKSMLYVMPIMMGFFTMSMPAGLGLYWTVSNLFGLVQSLILKKVFSNKYAKKEAV